MQREARVLRIRATDLLYSAAFSVRTSRPVSYGVPNTSYCVKRRVLVYDGVRSTKLCNVMITP